MGDTDTDVHEGSVEGANETLTVGDMGDVDTGVYEDSFS